MLFCILVMQLFARFHQHWLVGMHTNWERLNKKVIGSCRGRVNFGGYIFANFGKIFI